MVEFAVFGASPLVGIEFSPHSGCDLGFLLMDDSRLQPLSDWWKRRFVARYCSRDLELLENAARTSLIAPLSDGGTILLTVRIPKARLLRKCDRKPCLTCV